MGTKINPTCPSFGLGCGRHRESSQGMTGGPYNVMVAPEAELQQAGAKPILPNISKIPGQPWGKIKLS